MNLGQVGQLGKGVGVAQRDVDDSVVGQGGHGGEGGGLLAATGGSSRDEDTGELAMKATGLPLGTGHVPEGLPLGGEVAETRRDPDQERVVFGQGGRVGQHLDVGGLGGSVHLAEDLLGEGLRDPVKLHVRGLSVSMGCQWMAARFWSYWKRSASPPAALMPLTSASAMVFTWPYMEYWRKQYLVSRYPGTNDCFCANLYANARQHTPMCLTRVRTCVPVTLVDGSVKKRLLRGQGPATHVDNSDLGSHCDGLLGVSLVTETARIQTKVQSRVYGQR